MVEELRGASAHPAYWKWTPYFVVALLLSVPCVWQEHIQANDLSSHLYNAWLANQIAAGGLQGLYVVSEYTNVFFDVLLSGLLRTSGVLVTEHLAVLIAVQVFFWGCFALVSAVGRRAAWSIAPFIALLSYGAVFRLGFFNFYLSVGFCCAAIALVWGNRPRTRWFAAALLMMAVSAHILPVLWAIAVIGYILVARRLQPSKRWWLCGAGLAGVGSLALWLKLDVPARWTTGLRIDSFFGADQVLTFGAKYKFIAAGLLCFWILFLIRRIEMRPATLHDLAFQLWILSAAASLLLPDSIWLSFYIGGLSFITIRLSLLSGILLCAAIAGVPSKTPERIAQFALLGLFLFFTYSDERALNSMERKVNAAVVLLPPNSRVIATLKDSRLYIQALQHILDRPCIGRCFDFANYEPSTTQFRVRAKPGNRYLISSYDEIGKLEQGQWIFNRNDIDLYRLSPCGSTAEICVSPVKPSEPVVKQEIRALAAWAF